MQVVLSGVEWSWVRRVAMYIIDVESCRTKKLVKCKGVPRGFGVTFTTLGNHWTFLLRLEVVVLVMTTHLEKWQPSSFQRKSPYLSFPCKLFFCFVLWATIIYKSYLSSRSCDFSFCFCDTDHLRSVLATTLHISALSIVVAPCWVHTAITTRSSRNPKPFKVRAFCFE